MRDRRQEPRNADGDDAAEFAPGVQHCQEANLGAEVFGVSGNSAQRFGRGGKENIVNDALILQRQRSKLLWQRKHHMEILNRQEIGQPGFEPAGLGQ